MKKDEYLGAFNMYNRALDILLSQGEWMKDGEKVILAFKQALDEVEAEKEKESKELLEKDMAERHCRHWYDYCEPEVGEVCRANNHPVGCCGVLSRCQYPDLFEEEVGHVITY